MPLILKNRSDRTAFRFGRQAAFRSTSELVDQLHEQLQSERAQHRCTLAIKELAIALRELAQARVELDKRDCQLALAFAASLSASFR